MMGYKVSFFSSLTSLKSEFSFSLTGYHTKVKESSLLLLLDGKKRSK